MGENKNGDDSSKNYFEQVYYSYSTNINQLEEENKMLRDSVSTLKAEVDRLKKAPLMVCEVKEVFHDHAIVRIPNGNLFYVSVLKDCEKLEAGDSVLAEQKNLTIIKKLDTSKTFDVEKFVILEKPRLSWNEIGGLAEQRREIQEVIELPLKKPKLFRDVGIKPPKGLLLYGPSGTGKTLLAKAVASSTNSTFLEVVGSELVQKFIGEGAKLVKEVFQLAREKAPTIIFIDEIDAIAATRVDIGTSGEREVQRTFMQLLAEIDGFKPLDNVKIIGCTNRKDILDPAVIRPGRLDRLIRVPLPDECGRKEVFRIHTKEMSTEKFKAESLVKAMDKFSGAEIRAVCTEAGYFAIRDDRKTVTQKDFIEAIKKVKMEEQMENKDYLRIFG